LLVEEYTNLVKKIFSAKNSRQQGNDRVAGLKQKNGFTLSDEQRQSCIEQLKAAFTEALRYSEDKDREAKLGMPLDDLVDESCPITFEQHLPRGSKLNLGRSACPS
jgi:hypothetical protein